MRIRFVKPQVYEAGWPSKNIPWHRKFGWCWVWVRNYIIGWNIP